MQQKIILHVPHASTRISLLDGYVVDSSVLEKEMLKLTDWYTDDLFYSEKDEMIVADFSRIFCDPERFSDDAQEVMAQYGMGVLYEKSDNGEVIRIVSPELREKILQSYYWRHHSQFSAAVNDQLVRFGKAFIVDCHSYPSKPLTRDLDQQPIRPDFNIGTDAFHTPQELVDTAVTFFEKAGYSVGVDWPYSGAIVPMEHYRKNKGVVSIMLEVNRALYLQEPSNQQSDSYFRVKETVQGFIQAMKNTL
jgi:N-formylglutamate amidohydrolase